MEHSAPKPKPGVRKYLRKKLDKVFSPRPSPTPGPSQQPSQESSVRFADPHPTPDIQNSPTTCNDDSISTIPPALPSMEVPLAPQIATPVSGGPPDGLLVSDQPATVESPVFEALSPAKTSPTLQLPTIVGPSADQVALGASEVSPGPTSPQAFNSTPSDSRCPFNGVWKGLDSSLKTLQSAEAAQNQQEYEDLAEELKSLTETLAQRMSPSTAGHMSRSVSKLARDIETQSRLIESKRGRGTACHMLEARTDIGEITKCYRRIESLFRQLQADATLSMWTVINDQMAGVQLAKLNPVKLAYYDSGLPGDVRRCACTEGTRIAILAELGRWSRDPGAAGLYWMNGMAGTGKTTIAYTFSESLESRDQLAASFFCTRAIPECRDVNKIIPTIAYQFAHYSIPYQSMLCEILGSDPNVAAKTPTKQFERLLKEPLLKIKNAMPSELVVVIDAIDECEDAVGVELLLSLLLKAAVNLPLKVFVTSRPEPEIYKRMLDCSQEPRTVMHLHEVEKSLVQADIELYLEAELKSLSPRPSEVKELARRSGTLFIYAATLVRYIQLRKAQANPQQRLHDVLSMNMESNNRYSAIDSLYRTVLSGALDEEGLELQEVDNVRRVLQTVICIREPVALEVLVMLAGTNNEAAASVALQPLRAVLHVSETTGLVSTLHASFPDFMLDETRSGPLCCRLAGQSELITQRCFSLMKSELKFNMCKLESSFIPDHKIANIEKRVEETVSPALWYACRYWGHHLKCSGCVDQLSAQIQDFLSNQLLFWVEVLNLKREVKIGIEALLEAKQWMQAGWLRDAPGNLARLAQDARDFLTSFGASPVSLGTPHIYISALPFAAKSSFLFEGYRKKAIGVMGVVGTAMQARESGALAEWKTNSKVFAISYSPDGSRIAIGSEDEAIAIKNAYNGSAIAGPLKGHTGGVLSVAHSPDGTRVASGFHDTTIRVWSADDGILILGPLEGHTSSVNSVVYSPDGTRIVSGSSDNTIRVWNAYNGKLVAGPLEGHSGSVRSIAYSPDGTRIASGSSDATVRVWNAHDSKLVAGPFKGHTGWVNSVTYSPDGTRIASGSSDNDVRVWNAHSGTLVAGPLKGHTRWINSVAYSPDGTRIASGSSDQTVRVWDAGDGSLVAGPLEGHNSLVISVIYSPDGTRIASGSSDTTIRLWNAYDGALITNRLEGHTRLVLSVAYSPDGTHIVSGSADKIIRVWNAHDGTQAVGPLKGHTYSVNSVAYSPDGTRIVSGSSDKTIRVWDAHDGTLVVGPLKGHTSSVHSVTYSPDGSRIVSGSLDKTIRVWNAHDGTLVTGPLKGHTWWVNSVACSPDSTRIVSGSSDKTIRVWGAHNGSLVVGPLEGHTDWVISVVYSPDGTRIVSGSDDETVRVWDARDGTLVLGPLKGHTHSVRSVAYSPNGTHIVSGSGDTTICIWDAHNGTLVAGPFEGHTQWVNSVAYSPDGTRVVSGSGDKTIRVWNTQKHASLPILSPPHSPSSNPTYHDGWIVDANKNLLFWVPPELRSAFISLGQNCVLLIDSQGRSLGVDYGDMLFGPRWHQCYTLEYI